MGNSLARASQGADQKAHASKSSMNNNRSRTPNVGAMRRTTYSSPFALPSVSSVRGKRSHRASAFLDMIWHRGPNQSNLVSAREQTAIILPKSIVLAKEREITESVRILCGSRGAGHARNGNLTNPDVVFESHCMQVQHRIRGPHDFAK